MANDTAHHHLISAVNLPGASSSKGNEVRRAMPVAKAYSMSQILDSVKGNTSVSRPENARPETPFASPRKESAAPEKRAKAARGDKRGLFTRDRFSERLSRLK